MTETECCLLASVALDLLHVTLVAVGEVLLAAALGVVLHRRGRNGATVHADISVGTVAAGGTVTGADIGEGEQ